MYLDGTKPQTCQCQTTCIPSVSNRCTQDKSKDNDQGKESNNNQKYKNQAKPEKTKTAMRTMFGESSAKKKDKEEMQCIVTEIVKYI